MNTAIKIKKDISMQDFSSHLFWDTDLSKFDLDKHKSFLIQRVIEYGTLNDWKLIKEFYGLETIKKLSLEFRTLDVVSLSFLSTLFKIDKTEFRCYRHKQSVPNCWNS